MIMRIPSMRVGAKAKARTPQKEARAKAKARASTMAKEETRSVLRGSGLIGVGATIARHGTTYTRVVPSTGVWLRALCTLPHQRSYRPLPVRLLLGVCRLR